MKKHFLPLILALLLPMSVMAQSFTLTFTGKDANRQWVQLDHVVVTNLTKGWQETIVWPDTVLTMQNTTGIEDAGAFHIVETFHETSLQLLQNNPNPFNGTTDVLLMVADAGAVMLTIMDMNGRVMVETFHETSLHETSLHETSLPVAICRFRVTLSAAGIYVMTARQNGKISSIKMVNNGGANGDMIEYMETAVETFHETSLPFKYGTRSGTRGNTTNPFNIDDMMEYVGYAFINDMEVESEHIMQSQITSQTFDLHFDVSQIPQQEDGQPCYGNETILDRDGNTYNTVWIGTQCWMKENLRTTKYADGMSILQGSGISEDNAFWYYPNGNSTNKPTYGLLYNWNAVMHNSSSSSDNPSGVQGICPDGWHVPSDEEWTQLTDYVSSQSAYVCGSSDMDIAKALAGTMGWTNSGNPCAVGNDLSNNNATNFSALPAGGYIGDYEDFESYAYFWSATESDRSNAYGRYLYYFASAVYRTSVGKIGGHSVRCLRD